LRWETHIVQRRTGVGGKGLEVSYDFDKWDHDRRTPLIGEYRRKPRSPFRNVEDRVSAYIRFKELHWGGGS